VTFNTDGGGNVSGILAEGESFLYVVLAPGWNYLVKSPGVKELNESHMRKFNREADAKVGPAYTCIQVLAPMSLKEQVL
jgi:hypothetical protein